MMMLRSNPKDESFNEIHCPLCGHFLLKEAHLEGLLEIKCRTCKATMRLCADKKIISIALF